MIMARSRSRAHHGRFDEISIELHGMMVSRTRLGIPTSEYICFQLLHVRDVYTRIYNENKRRGDRTEPTGVKEGPCWQGAVGVRTLARDGRAAAGGMRRRNAMCARMSSLK